MDATNIPVICGTVNDNQVLENAILVASGDSRRNIDALKLQASSSKNYFEKLFQDHENRLVPYRTDLHQLQQTYSEYENKKKLLELEIIEIEKEMLNISTKTSTIEKYLNELQLQHEKQINSLNSSHGHVVEAIEKDSQLNKIITNLQNLESVMDDVAKIGINTLSTLSHSSNQTVNTDHLIELFVAYSKSESKCVEFLSRRVQLMKEKTNYSQREATEYKNLGMNVS